MFGKKKNKVDKITAIIIAVFFLYFMIEDSLDIVIPLFFEEKKINIIFYGTLLTVTRVIRAVIVAPVSVQSIRKKFLILKTVIAADMAILLVFIGTSSQTIIFAGFSILIITTSIINVILNPILGLYAKDRVGIIFGLRDAFLYAGCFLGLLIVGAIKNLANSTNIIWILYCCIFAMIFISICRLEKELNGKQVEESQEAEKKEKSKKFRIVNKNLIYYIAIVFILGLSGAYTSYLPLIAMDMGIKENSIFYIFSSSTFISAVLAITGGMAIDRFNKKKLFQLDIVILIVILMLYASDNKTVFVLAIIIAGLATALDNVMNAYVFVNFSEEEVNQFWGL